MATQGAEAIPGTDPLSGLKEAMRGPSNDPPVIAGLPISGGNPHKRTRPNGESEEELRSVPTPVQALWLRLAERHNERSEELERRISLLESLFQRLSEENIALKDTIRRLEA